MMSSAVQDASNQASSLPVTAIIFAGISLVLYFWLLKPLLLPPEQQANQAARTAVDNPARVATPQRRRARQQQQRATSRENNHNNNDIVTLLEKHTRCPPHMAPEASTRYLDTGGISLLSQGILPFRHSRAAAYEQALATTSSSAENIVSNNRKDRARILARILALNGGASMTPPSRGATVVVSIPVTQDLNCDKLRRVLYLLSTHFNTVVILSNVSSTITDKDVDVMVATLRGSQEELPQDVLPRHRIVAAQSITGRVAVCRQLGQVEFVLDFDEEMQAQLGRFGFRVLVYPPSSNSNKKGVSGLGHALLSS